MPVFSSQKSFHPNGHGAGGGGVGVVRPSFETGVKEPRLRVFVLLVTLSQTCMVNLFMYNNLNCFGQYETCLGSFVFIDNYCTVT